MRTNIKTTNITLIPEISDYLNKRLESLNKLIQGREEESIVDVEVGRTTNHHHTGDIFRAEINVHIGKKSFRAVRETGNIYSSIDEAKDHIMDELRSDKGKTIHLIRRGSQKVKALIKNFYYWRKK